METKVKNKEKGVGYITTPKLTKEQKDKLKVILKICSENHFITKRNAALRKAGFGVSEKPMETGGGIGNYIQMANGGIRVRVSANWGGKKGNYANCVSI